MARPSGPKTRCGGTWTEARYIAFVKNLLRQGTRKWAPIQRALKKSSTKRGFFLCASCKQECPTTIVNDDGNRVKNKIADHIKPVIDPAVGFMSWDEFIEGLFTEEDNLQILCHKCHQEKCNEEIKIATERRRNV